MSGCEPPLMVLGTSSSVGKSLMTAGLCRLLKRRGGQPVPFKGQNMSLNAYVDAEGGEMAYAQALQAWAAGLEPAAAMNPVLLKPQGNGSSEIIHLGRRVGAASAEDYYRDWFTSGWHAIRQGLSLCQEGGRRLVVEGAGSPVEMNLQARDLTNLRIARFLQARCLLVADIERGGVFAQIVGTLHLLRPEERRLIAGILVNRFRGQRRLFDAGRTWLEQETGIPVLGVMPWLGEQFPAEDSLALLERCASKPDAELRLAVIRLPSIGVFSDFDPLEAEASVKLDWLPPTASLTGYDAVLLPGSKQTIGDLQALRAAGMDRRLQHYAATGGTVFGICGGLQMLGQTLDDPEALESDVRQHTRGLDLLPMATAFEPEKVQHRVSTASRWPVAALPCTGFELHYGRSRMLHDDLPAMFAQPHLGWVSKRGNVAGTYLHGVFDSGEWRRHWLNRLRHRRGLEPLPVAMPDHRVHRDRLLDRLADAVDDNMNLEPLLGNP